MLYLVRTSLSRDLGNMSNASLYSHSHVGTKSLIDQYITAAVDTISTMVELSERKRCDALELKYIQDQLLAARQAFGRSALLFSGGATFGMSHIGVLKALWEAKLLPRILSGSSAGSVVCAIFCTRTEEELPGLLHTFADGDFAVFNETGHEDNIFQKAARFLKYGSWVDSSHLARAMRSWLGDITFQEAYNRTRRILNICVSSASIYELPRLLNYITAPNVLIWSAVAVSCSVPLVFSPYVLMAKDPLTGEPVPWNDLHKQYIDGSVESDLPMSRLSEMFNVNHFIVSQVNPHVLPFLSKDECSSGNTTADRNAPPKTGWLHTITHLAKDEALYRMTVFSDLGIFPTFLTKAVSVMNQKYFGDITIFPEIPYTSFPLMLKNPTTGFMLQACLGGERATWPKLGRIRNHLAIELALDSAIQTMRARVAFYPTEADPVTNCTFVHRHITSIDTNGRRGRMTQRRRGSYNQEQKKLKLEAGCQSGSCPARKPRIARKYSSFENSCPQIPLNTFSPEVQEKGVQPGIRASSIPPTYPTGRSSIAGSDNGDDIDLYSTKRPKYLVHRASWGPCSHQRTTGLQDHQSPQYSHSQRPSSLSSQSQRSSSADAGDWHSSSTKGVQMTAKPFLTPSCRVLKMTATDGVDISDPTSWKVNYHARDRMT
ncbi:hypothetical protein MAP00_006510 [Monascus purpureus]|nr:hypothetical protein MAP00_006510 [Monascus purpureus]